MGLHAKAMRTAIRVAANTAAVTEYLPVRLAAWMSKNPRIDVELKERQSNDIARAVLRGFVEIGILSDAADTAGMELVPFATDQLVVITARHHSLTESKHVSFSDLLQEQFIGLSAGALQEHIEMQAVRLGDGLKFERGSALSKGSAIWLPLMLGLRSFHCQLPVGSERQCQLWLSR